MAMDKVMQEACRAAVLLVYVRLRQGDKPGMIACRRLRQIDDASKERERAV